MFSNPIRPIAVAAIIPVDTFAVKARYVRRACKKNVDQLKFA
jgi:hypothetical protein